MLKPAENILPLPVDPHARALEARLVNRGDQYGLDGCFINDEETMLEFYDVTAHDAGSSKFVSCYFLSTLMGVDKHDGITLDAATPGWALSAEVLQQAVKWAMLRATPALRMSIPPGTEIIIDIESEEDAPGIIVSAQEDGVYLMVAKIAKRCKVEDVIFANRGKLSGWNDVGWLDPIYVTEMSKGYCKLDFLRLMDGDESAANMLFDTCEWQAAETLIDELGKEFFLNSDDERAPSPHV